MFVGMYRCVYIYIYIHVYNYTYTPIEHQEPQRCHSVGLPDFKLLFAFCCTPGPGGSFAHAGHSLLQRCSAPVRHCFPTGRSFRWRRLRSCGANCAMSEKGEVLLRGVGTLR